MAINWRLSGKQDVYVEVAEYFEDYILRGVFASGDKLPSVRMAAGELSVNPNTVAKAYSLLEEKGYIRAFPKKGAFVIYSADEPSNEISNGEETKNEKTGNFASAEESTVSVTYRSARICRLYFSRRAASSPIMGEA